MLNILSEIINQFNDDNPKWDNLMLNIHENMFKDNFNIYIYINGTYICHYNKDLSIEDILKKFLKSFFEYILIQYKGKINNE